MKSRILRGLALLPLPIVTVLVVWSGARPLPPPPVLVTAGTSGPSASVEAFQLPPDVGAGWRVEGKIERYDEKSLFDRIDGAAPAYIRAGFVYSLAAEVRKAGMNEGVAVDLYAMGAPARALGMYATERDPSYRFIEVGRAGYLASGSLNFWKGQFYVKLAGYEEGAAMDRALSELARELAALLPDPPESEQQLAPLALLPREGKLPNSEGYAYPALGDVQGLEQVFYASYEAGTQSFRLFVAMTASDAEAAGRFQRVGSYFRQDGSRVNESSAGGFKALVAEGESTTTFVVQRGRVLAGGIDLPDARLVGPAEERLVRALGSALPASPAEQKRP